jgi:hypothetical protein
MLLDPIRRDADAAGTVGSKSERPGRGEPKHDLVRGASGQWWPLEQQRPKLI